MNAKSLTFIRHAGLVAGAVVALTGLRLSAADLPADAFPKFDNYIKLTGQATSIDGNTAAFQNRTTQPSDIGYGLEALHIAKESPSGTTMTINGKALAGAEDYLGQVTWTKDEVGKLDIGFKSFRTFYQGAGGFFPINRSWRTLEDQSLNLDRSKFWIDATVELPNAPVFSFKYINELRDGQKDTTIYGSTQFTGLPYTIAPNPINSTRKLTPSWMDVSERHQNAEFSVKYAFKNTTTTLTLFHDETNNRDTRSVWNFPGQNIPYKSPAYTTAELALRNPQDWSNQNFVQHTEGMATRTNGAHGLVVVDLSESMKLRVAGAYNVLRNEITGDRPIVTYTPGATGIVPVTTNNTLNLTGGARIKTLTGNIALDWNITKDLFASVGLSGEDEYITKNVGYTVVTATSTTPRLGWAKITETSVTPAVELRYNGFKSLSLYFTGRMRDLSGTEKNTSAYNPLTAVVGTTANMDISETHGDYTLGANWRMSSFLSLRAEIFSKDHEDEAAGFAPNLGDYYLLESQFVGAKLTATIKPMASLTFTGRLVHQKGEMQVTGYLPTFPAYDSCDAQYDIVSGTIDWNPSPTVYAQLAGNAVFNTISTIYPRAGVTPATTTNASFDSNRILQDSQNDYTTVSLLVGFVLDEKTDIQVQGTDYRASNGNASLAALTVPYGVDTHDYIVTVGLKRKLNDRLVMHAKLGFVDSDNKSYGGLNDYRGPLAYLSFDHAL